VGALRWARAAPICRAAPRRASQLAVSRPVPTLAQVDRGGSALGASRSDYFEGVAGYKLILSEAEIDAGVAKVAHILNTQFVGEKIVLCGILKGAFVFMSDLVKKLERPYSIYFVEASSYSGQKQSDEIDLLSRIVPAKFAGRRVVLVDELLDNGHTMHTMAAHLMKTLEIPREQISTCVLFSKVSDTRPAEYGADICGIPDLPNVWLVGYGLDDNGTKRGWTELFAKPKIEGVPKCEADGIFEPGTKGRQLLRTYRREMRAGLGMQ
jgi:hypoxanthine phosphoribosyltransferase